MKTNKIRSIGLIKRIPRCSASWLSFFFVIPASKARRESFFKKDSGQAGMTGLIPRSLLRGCSLFLLALLMIMNISCGGGGSSSSSNMTDVSIKMIAATASDIAKLKFTISAPDMSTIERTVDVSGAQPGPYLQASLVSGDTVIVHFDVPNGLSRHVVVEALDAAGAVIYIGDAYVDLDGTAKSVEITLNPPGSGPIVQCNNLTIAGGDTPETHTVELNQTSGTFDFLYETYGIADRMLVKYQGNILYDSGCVTTVSTVSQTISYSGTSTQVTVEIQPNCSGTTTGTAWTFTVTCPQALSTPVPINLSGSWNFFNTPQGGTELPPDIDTITQTGNSFTISGMDNSAQPPELVTGQGTITGNNVSITATQQSCGKTATHIFTGTISADGNSVSGTYTSTGGCTTGTETGTWRMVRGTTPIDLSGNWCMTVASTEHQTNTLTISLINTSLDTYSWSGLTPVNGEPISMVFTVSGNSLSILAQEQDNLCGTTVSNLNGTTDGNTFSANGTSQEINPPPSCTGSHTWGVTLTGVRGPC